MSVACVMGDHDRCQNPGDCICVCHDPPDAQDRREWAADEKLQRIEEDGPRRELDEYDF